MWRRGLRDIAKEDAPPPRHPPRKRYQLEGAPDHWIAVWATDQTLPEAERTRASEERERRKQLQPENTIGVLLDREGITDAQMQGLRELLAKARPTAVHHPYCSSRVHTACKSPGAPVEVHGTARDEGEALRRVVLAANAIIALPRTTETPTARTRAWEAVAYARHRKLPVSVVLPGGDRL